MKFKIIYLVGQSERETIITALNLDEAEKIADKKYPKWIDIIMLDLTKGEKPWIDY